MKAQRLDVLRYHRYDDRNLGQVLFFRFVIWFDPLTFTIYLPHFPFELSYLVPKDTVLVSFSSNYE